jgi:hypothetical protein
LECRHVSNVGQGPDSPFNLRGPSTGKTVTESWIDNSARIEGQSFSERLFNQQSQVTYLVPVVPGARLGVRDINVN